MGVHESLDAGGHEPATQVEVSAVCTSTHVPPKKHTHGCSELFSLGFPIFA